MTSLDSFLPQQQTCSKVIILIILLSAVSPVEEEEAGGCKQEAPQGPAVDAGHHTVPTSLKPGRWFPRLER